MGSDPQEEPQPGRYAAGVIYLPIRGLGALTQPVRPAPLRCHSAFVPALIFVKAGIDEQRHPPGMIFITYVAIIIALTLGTVLHADAMPARRRAHERRYMP